jgi:hypothetical protein
MNNVTRFPGTFETPASTARKPSKRGKPDPAISPEDAAMLAAFNRLSEYGRKIAVLKMGYWADREAIEVESGNAAWVAWGGIGG